MSVQACIAPAPQPELSDLSDTYDAALQRYREQEDRLWALSTGATSLLLRITASRDGNETIEAVWYERYQKLQQMQREQQAEVDRSRLAYEIARKALDARLSGAPRI